MFRRITVSGWRQFRDITVDFDPKLTILTGANGAGKTTILNLLNKHFGWDVAFVSTPRRRKELVEYFTDYWEGVPTGEDAQRTAGDRVEIGKLQYTDGSTAGLYVPTSHSPEYQVALEPRQQVPGLFLPSHRPAFIYQAVETIPTTPTARTQLLQTYLDEVRARSNLNSRVRSPSHRIKEALIALAVFGYGNAVVTPNDVYRETFDGFQKILSMVLPPSMGFRSLRVDMPNVVLDTSSGQFSLDAVSGGVSALIDIAWQLYMYSLEREGFAAVIDEPENHLHPQLQQMLMPALVAAFPKCQFVISTHNPLVVTSVRDAAVYVLRFDDDLRVWSERLDLINKASTANDILRDVLGLDFTMPLWAEEQLRSLVTRFSSEPMTSQSASRLREELEAAGLGNLFPEALGSVVDEQR